MQPLALSPTTSDPRHKAIDKRIVDLVTSRHMIDAAAPLEAVQKVFKDGGQNFMAVVDGERLVGLCSASNVGMILGSRFGFSIFGKKPISEFILREAVIVSETMPMEHILRSALERSSDSFYDDIILTHHDGRFLGLIEMRSLIKLQNHMLEEKLRQVERHERELRQANFRLEDMTREIQITNENLARARDKALDAVRLKSEFLATVSHEIRTPMNGVIGMINLLMDSNLDPEQEYFARTVRSSAESLLIIINDILDFSKIEAGKLDIQEDNFNLKDLLESSLQLMLERTASKGLELIWDVDPQVPESLTGDPIRLRQIILNLVGNATKFTDRGEVLLQISLLQKGSERAHIRFEIRDTGPGIEESQLKRLFAPFTQADGSSTRKHGGTGLGLSICKRLVELMEGRIGCCSEFGHGSTFWFELPFAYDPASDQSFTPVGSNSHKALFIIPNPTLREVLSRQCSQQQLPNRAVRNIAEAVEALEATPKEEHPDAIVFDMGLPSEELQAFCKRIKSWEATKSIRLVALSPVGKQFKQQAMEDLSIRRSLFKPVRARDLVHIIEHDKAPTREAEVVMAPHSSFHTHTKLPATSDKEESMKGKVLIVEDTPTNQAVARLFINKLGYDCEIASSGEEALVLLQEHEYDCVLMDCMMPGMDGFETTRQIRAGNAGEDRKGIPIVAMTANAMQGDRERCLQSGMDDYLSKPLRKGQLEEKLAQVVRPAGTEHA